MTRILTCVKRRCLPKWEASGRSHCFVVNRFHFSGEIQACCNISERTHLCLSHSYFSVEPEQCITSLCCGVRDCACDSAQLLFSYFWLVGQRCVDIMYLCTPHPLCQTSTNLLHPHWCPLCLPNISCKVPCVHSQLFTYRLWFFLYCAEPIIKLNFGKKHLVIMFHLSVKVYCFLT